MPKFNLLTLLEWVAGAAFVAALFANSGGYETAEHKFSNLPADDSALRAWLDDETAEGITIERTGNKVRLRKAVGVWKAIMVERGSIPAPPWTELGYPVPTGNTWSMNWTLFGGSLYLWLAGFAILLILGQVRRRLTGKGDRARDS